MNEREQNEKSQALAREWFQAHVARYVPLGNPDFVVIEWRRPGTGNYAMQFIIAGHVVIVTGDVGEAIYGFTGAVTPEQLLTFDWHYFINKCVASETGRNYTMKMPGIKRPVPNVRAIGHYIGLTMALKQLLNK